MDRLHLEEFDFLRVISSSKNTAYFFHIGSELRGQLEAHDWLKSMDRFEKLGLIKIEKIRINYAHAFLDTLLQPFSKAMKNGDIKAANELAKVAGLPSLMKTNAVFHSLDEINNILELVFDERAEVTNLDPTDTEFGKDLLEAIELDLTINKEASQFFRKYVDAFIHDKLPQSKKDTLNLLPSTNLVEYRYKTQRQIFCDFLKRQIVLNNPNHIKIIGLEPKDFARMDIDLLAEALMIEGIIDDYDYSMEKGFPYHMVVKVNEEKLLDPTKTETQLKLSFDTNRKLLTMIDELGTTYNERFQGAAQLDVLRKILKEPIDFSTDWNVWDVAEMLERSEKSITNAIYQINKRIRNIFPDVEHFIAIDGDYFRINAKYVREK